MLVIKRFAKEICVDVLKSDIYLSHVQNFFLISIKLL